MDFTGKKEEKRLRASLVRPLLFLFFLFLIYITFLYASISTTQSLRASKSVSSDSFGLPRSVQAEARSIEAGWWKVSPPWWWYLCSSSTS